MNEKELLEAIEQKMADIKTGLDQKAESSEIEKLKLELESLRAKATTEQLASLKKEYEDLTATLVKQGEEITKLKEPKAAGSFKSLETAITEAFAAKKEEIDAIVASGGTGQTKSLVIEVKAAVDITTENTIGAGSTQYTLTQNTGKISQIRKRELTYDAAVSTGRIGTQRALWIEETDEQGTPIFIGEGDSKTQLSVKYVEQTQSVKKIAVYGKVTTEMLADLPQLISYIQNNLMRRMDIKIEDQLFSGAGTGDDLKGMITYATAFAADASIAAQIPNANELDVIEAIALQVKTAYGIPNTLFIHPGTMSKIKLIKDEVGRPVWKDYVTTNGMMNVSGLNIIETTAITEGDFVGGDTKVVNKLVRDEMGITIGLDGNDFTNNKKTMLLEKRLVQFVSANDTAVLVTGDFDTAKAALQTP